MNVDTVKVLVLLGLFVMTFLVGILPVVMIKLFKRSRDLHRKRLYKLTLSFLSCYAAGVFLGTGLLDLLPDVRIDLASAFNSMNVTPHFPVAEAVMMCGLFLILLVEQIVLTVKERNPHLYSHEPNTQTSLLSDSQENISSSHGAIDNTSLDGGQQCLMNGTLDGGQQCLMNGTLEGGKQCLMNGTHPVKSNPHHSAPERPHSVISDSGSIHGNGSIHGISDEPFPSSSFEGSGLMRQQCDSCVVSIELSRPYEENNEGGTAADELNPCHEHSSLRSLLLLLALSLHSVFEGFPVGLQKKSDDVIGIFAALAVHKCIVSFSLGMNLIQSKLSHGGIVKSIVFFSLTTPAGIGIGIGIINLWDSPQSTLAQGILSGIACGTFLYVTFFEVLPCEFNCHDQRLLKVLFLLLGFITTVAVSIFLHNDHHGEPQCHLVPPGPTPGS